MSSFHDLIISDIALSPDAGDGAALSEAKKRIEKHLPACKVVSEAVYRCSVDARRRNNVRLVYSVLCTVEGGEPDKEALSAYTAPILPLPLPWTGFLCRRIKLFRPWWSVWAPRDFLPHCFLRKGA